MSGATFDELHQLRICFEQPETTTATKPATVAHVDASRIVNEFRAGTSQGVLCDRHGIEAEALHRVLLGSMAASDAQTDAAIERLGIVGDTLASDEATR